MLKKLIATGLIVEYNPFHNGHIHHIQKALEITQCDVLIAVMSPHFVQRGEPAFIDKWARTQSALDAGVDIVIELPTYYALQSADYFAQGAITLLQLLHIGHLVYGVETLDATPPHFNKEKLTDGKSFAASFDTTSSSPNNILAFAYEKVLEKTLIQPHRIQRTNDYLGLDITHTISSATAIRHAHTLNEATDHTTPMTFGLTHHLDEYEDLIRYALISQTPEQLKEYLLVDEGIEYLFKKHQDKPLNELIEACISTRYTRSRIKRTLLNILLTHRKNQPASLTQARILGFSPQGQTYLKQIKNDDATMTPSFKNYVNKDLEYKATQIYGLVKDSQTYQSLINDEVQKLIKT